MIPLERVIDSYRPRLPLGMQEGDSMGFLERLFKNALEPSVTRQAVPGLVKDVMA